jgi:choline dehydrogenase
VVVLQATAQNFGENPNKIWDLIHRDNNNDPPDRDKQIEMFDTPTHKTTNGVRVNSRNPVMGFLNATNHDGSKKYPLTLRTKSFVSKILFTATGSNSKAPRTAGAEFLAG